MDSERNKQARKNLVLYSCCVLLEPSALLVIGVKSNHGALVPIQSLHELFLGKGRATGTEQNINYWLTTTGNINVLYNVFIIGEYTNKGLFYVICFSNIVL